jgi:tetratricopeptide (TPR) repeat protein
VLRRIPVSHATWICIAILAACAVLTFQRNQLWGDPILLWRDTVSKSPRKPRPNFQLAHAYTQNDQCAQALPYFESAGRVDKRNVRMLLDWALTYECLGRYEDGLAKLQEAFDLDPSASTKATMAIFYGGLQRWPEVLRVLAEAEKEDPGYAYTYAYRGDYYEVQGDYAAAAAEYERALAVAPWLQKAKDGLARVSQRRP